MAIIFVSDMGYILRTWACLLRALCTGYVPLMYLLCTSMESDIASAGPAPALRWQRAAVALTTAIMIIKRICIHSNEVAEILGIGQKQALRKLKLMKETYGKRRDQYITFKEFSDYTAIPLEDVMAVCFPPKK